MVEKIANDTIGKTGFPEDIQNFMNGLATTFTEFYSSCDASIIEFQRSGAGNKLANTFGSSGFANPYYEPPPGNNQVRHAAAGLVVGYAFAPYGNTGLNRMNARENPNDPIHGVPDLNLNRQTVPMGVRIAGGNGRGLARGLADWIINTLCTKWYGEGKPMKHLSNYIPKVCAVALMLSMSAQFSACGKRGTAKNQERSSAYPSSYKMLYDELGAKISIGVGSEIDEQQLRATLARAADDHQNDAARDYLIADHLWVEAYLLDGEKQSTVSAGRLARYVPPRNPDAKNEDPTTQKEDQFVITLAEAKRTLK
jgi:hypothetical protein